MLFYKDLEKIIFTRNQLLTCDELIIISGYVGPMPVLQLADLPIKTTVIYGMYGADGIQTRLHNELLKCNSKLKNTNILYATTPVHSKCYIWRNKGQVVHSLIGSANFSINGLRTPYKEVLAETNSDTFQPLNEYLEIVISNSIDCTKGASKARNREIIIQDFDASADDGTATMPLFIEKNGIPEVPKKSGLNWGMGSLSGSHVNINDAYIPIRKAWLKRYVDLFPKKQKNPLEKSTGRGHRHNDAIEILWDDGTTMMGLLEGTQYMSSKNSETQYPKQISSHPSKAIMGEYLRNRIKVPEGVAITFEDLEKYGRTTIDISIQGEGIYYFDFSVQ